MTPDQRVDIAVIGAGITGLTAALHLSDAGCRIAVFDAGMNGGSNVNAGSLHVQLQSRFLRLYPDQAPNVEASLPLYLAATRAWDALDRRLGGVELVQKGGLMLAESATQMAFLEKKAERERLSGLDVDILDRAALEDIAPWLGDQVLGAELCRDEGKLNPLLANKAARGALASSGTVVTKRHVQTLELAPEGVRVCSDGGNCVAGHVILATSWGTKSLAADFGVNIPVAWEPLHMNITEPGDYRIEHLVQHAEKPITLKQFRSGQIVIGGGWEAKYDPAVGTPQVLKPSLLGNVALAAHLAPGIAHLRLMRTWAGLNTITDGKSIIGPLPGVPRVLVAVPGDAGYTLGPIIGPASADIALGRKPQFDTKPYAPDRFA